MMDLACRKGAYRELRRITLGEPLGFPNAAFDACFSVGVFTAGHASPESFEELVRVVRPGGWTVFGVYADVYEDGGFHGKQEALEESGKWRLARLNDPFTMFPLLA